MTCTSSEDVDNGEVASTVGERNVVIVARRVIVAKKRRRVVPLEGCLLSFIDDVFWLESMF